MKNKWIIIVLIFGFFCLGVGGAYITFPALTGNRGVLFTSGTNTVSVLPAGTSGNFLQTKGVGADPVFADAIEPTEIDTSAELAAILTDETGTGALNFGPALIPSGAVVPFNLASCPSGWTELTAARGRVVTGLPLSGTLAGTLGTALGNLAERNISTVVAHTHTTDSQGAHTHTSQAFEAVGSGAWEHQATYTNKTGNNPNPATSSAGAHTHTAQSTGSASVAVTMPYIQLLMCQKD